MRTALIFLVFVFVGLGFFPSSFAEPNPACDDTKKLVVVTDRYHYSLGDTVFVSGCLSDEMTSKELFLSVAAWVEVEGDVHLDSKTFLFEKIMPEDDGSFFYEFVLDEKFLDHKRYGTSINTGAETAETDIAVSEFGDLCSTASDENPFFVFTDKDNYQRDDTIKVFGCFAPIAYTKGVNVFVYDQNGNFVTNDVIVPDPSLTFSTEFEIDDAFAVDGSYTVMADAGGLYATNKTITVPEFGPLVIMVSMVAFSVIIFFGILKNFKKDLIR